MAVHWVGPRRTYALFPSREAVIWPLLGAAVLTATGLGFWLIEHWWALAVYGWFVVTPVFLVIVATTTVVTIDPDGVHARRLLRRRRVLPLGGTFRREPTDQEDDDLEDVPTGISYQVGDQVLMIDCFRGAAIIDWMNDQHTRVLSRRARV